MSDLAETYPGMYTHEKRDTFSTTPDTIIAKEDISLDLDITGITNRRQKFMVNQRNRVGQVDDWGKLSALKGDWVFRSKWATHISNNEVFNVSLNGWLLDPGTNAQYAHSRGLFEEFCIVGMVQSDYRCNGHMTKAGNHAKSMRVRTKGGISVVNTAHPGIFKTIERYYPDHVDVDGNTRYPKNVELLKGDLRKSGQRLSTGDMVEFYAPDYDMDAKFAEVRDDYRADGGGMYEDGNPASYMNITNADYYPVYSCTYPRILENIKRYVLRYRLAPSSDPIIKKAYRKVIAKVTDPSYNSLSDPLTTKEVRTLRSMKEVTQRAGGARAYVMKGGNFGRSVTLGVLR